MNNGPETLACYANKEPVNRKEKKLIFGELDRNLENYLDLETEFLEKVFDPEMRSYNDLYTKYLTKWNFLTDCIEKLKRFKYTSPNRSYFLDLYKPVEKEVKVNY